MNLDLLGQREPGIYGSAGLADLEKQLRAVAPGIAAAIGWPGVQLTFFQTNREHEFLEKISEGWDGALLNPGAWTHTSLALGDRLAALGERLPFVEVHLSHLSRREDFRKTSYSAPSAVGVVYGLGFHSYTAGLTGLLGHIHSRKTP